MDQTIDTTQQLITEVARIIGLPIIPMAPTAVHDSKPFPHLVQHPGGRLFLDGQLFDPLSNGRDFLLVEAWLERSNMSYQHEFQPADGGTHRFQIQVGTGMWFVCKKRPLAGCLSLVHQFGDDRLVQQYFGVRAQVTA